jgi:hypothetical protein
MNEPLFDAHEPVTLTHQGHVWTVTVASVQDADTVILQSASDGGEVFFQAFRRDARTIHAIGGEHLTQNACRSALDGARPSYIQASPAVRSLVLAALDGGEAG